jgi:hypothetical protein
MTFLQPLILAALPLIGLPIIIHLINQRRFQTMQWAAMMFLVSAKALSRGYSRLRHWLIMMLRMLAVAAILLAASRPLSRGWLALAGGGRADTSIVILDRSPSMQQQDPTAEDSDSKLDTGRRQLIQSLATLATGRLVVLTDPEQKPFEVESPAVLADLAAPVASPTDVPLLLQSAYDYVRENSIGSTEIWLCSDQRHNDWNPESGEWAGMREAFAKLPQQVRFQLLSYSQTDPSNVAVRVTSARPHVHNGEIELLVTVVVSRQESSPQLTLPLRFEIGQAASTVDIQLDGKQAVLKDHPIALGRGDGPVGPGDHFRGWGRVSIPADANVADNDFFFVFDRPATRRTLIVAADGASRQVLSLVAHTPSSKDQACEVEVLVPEDLAAVAWDEIALVIWQAPLPEGKTILLLEQFADRGGQLIFFPPEQPTEQSFAGVSWTNWTTHKEPLHVLTWRSDQDLLANTASGAALPIGELEVRRSCGLAGPYTPLASLPADATFLARATGQRGGVYFCTSTPSNRDSTLATEGIVLYALVQRAIDRGAEVIGKTRQVDADTLAAGFQSKDGQWTRLAGSSDALSTEMGLHSGVYQRGDRLVAINRPAAEDAASILADGRIDELFAGLSFSRISGRAGDDGSFVKEIWRMFLVAMLLALIGEAVLCLPKRSIAEPSLSSGMRSLEAVA